MSSTDYAPGPDIDLPSGPLPLLDIEGLRQIVQFIDRLCQKGRDAKDPEDSQSSCPVPESSYD